ncbi:hypothetical protein EV144_101120 [Flavobacterium sp. 270]|uniref:hypothetical protein n=1 Tax=Flavobacterium sp. 270 TaxID=2512114 RepID=UPI0010651710|nr:hypothetical protein [Flavobacterium sp. 270]TDW51445.1 hypothetical protein EV144_101120 [Flavobacterium sp. 270]
MILYGVASKGNAREIECFCPKCDQREKLVFQSLIKSFHLFWLKCFPLFKEINVQCTKCATKYKGSQFTPEMFSISLRLRNELKYSIWNFTGLFVIAGLIIWAKLPASESEQKRIKELNEKAYKEFAGKLADPKYNDVYYLDKKDTVIGSDTYAPTAFLIVKNVTKDSIQFSVCNFEELSKKSGHTIIRSGFKKEYYGDAYQMPNKIQIAKNQITKDTLIFNSKIYQIDREKI